MAQHDYVIDNGPGLAVRQDMNAVLQAVVTQNSGPIEPSTPFPGMFWLDTSFPPNGLMRQRNQSNTAWIGATLGNIVKTLRATSGTWTKPTGLRFLEVELQASGGGGGGATGSGAGATSQGAGGGAGGGCRSLYRAETLPDSVVITIGALGSGGETGPGQPAGLTSFGALMSATGGEGGLWATAGNPGTTNLGGDGGIGSGGNIVNLKGQGGAPYVALTLTFVHSGAGGMSPMGGGGGESVRGSINGRSGNRGGGGSGACASEAAQVRTGGNGGLGGIILTEYF